MIPEVQEYLGTLVLKNSKTQAQYTRDITQFCNILEITDIKGLDSIQPKHLNAYLQYAKSHSWSNNTINSRMAAIKPLYKFLVENGYSTNTIVSKFAKLSNDTKETRALTESECNAILQYMSDNGLHRNFALFAFILDSGLRKFEYTKLKISDIKGNKIFVEGKRGKKCDIILSQNTVDLLWEYIRGERASVMRVYNQSHDYVFVSGTGKQMDATSFLKSIKGYAKIVGIEDWENVTVHGVRHSGLSIFYKHTKDIKATARKARHSDPALTARIYVHQDEEEFAKQVEDSSFKPNIEVHNGR
jgi:site-specific recombinase XerD